MRKAFSITFVVLILMNSMGFYGLFLGLQIKNDAAMVCKLDHENLEGFETVTLKIPLTLPYAESKNEFVRIDGKYEYQGEYFRLVKQKLFRDTLTIVCVKDKNEKRIAGAIKDYVKTYSQQHSENNGSKLHFSVIKDYFAQSFSLEHTSGGWSTLIGFTSSQSSPQSIATDFPEQPPRIG